MPTDSKEVAGTAKRRPPAAGKGRVKGTPNKVTRELKEMILQALDGAGGVDYLIQCANEPRTASAFLTLVGKVLPMTVQGPGADGAHVFAVIERRVVRPGD
jgi:hypothetical protein